MCSIGSLANPGESNEAASASHTEFVPSVEDLGASHNGDPPHTGRVGPDATSGSALHRLVVPDGATLTTLVSSGPQRSAMHPFEPASGGMENLSAHSPVQCSSDDTILASVPDPPGGVRLATDTLPRLQRSAVHPPSSAAAMHDLTR
jgi:hypothetical protein